METNIGSLMMKIASFSVLLPALFALFRIRNGTHSQRVLSVLVFVFVFVEASASIIGNYFKLPNLPLLHIFTIIEFGLLAYIYKVNFQSIITPRVYDGLIIGFAIFSILNSSFNESIFEFNALARAVEALLLIMLVLFYFYTTLQTLSDKYLESSPLFWISVGILFYFSASFFIFIYSNHLMGSEDQSFTIWGMHALMNIVLNIFYTIALWVKPKI